MGKKKKISPKTDLPTWLLGDHLGSTSMVADETGEVVSEVRYSAFGEIRYDSGTMTTDYLFTGQRQDAKIGLYYYVARWYDPAIGRFIQADSVISSSTTPLAYDRYAYAYNNPCNNIDPSGHICIRGMAGIGNIINTVSNIFGGPDCRGIINAMLIVDKNKEYNDKVDNIYIAAGIAVQSEWSGFWDFIPGLSVSGSSGYGWAQAGKEEYQHYGIDFSPAKVWTADEVMANRLKQVFNKMENTYSNLKPIDYVYAAALGMNNDFHSTDPFHPAGQLKSALGKGNSPNWKGYYQEDYGVSGSLLIGRTLVTGRQYNAINTVVFINDMLALDRWGYDLPAGLTRDDLIAAKEEVWNWGKLKNLTIGE